MAVKNQAQGPVKDLDEAISASEAFIIKYKNKLLIALSAIVLVVVAILGYKQFIYEPREVKASEALFVGEQYFQNDQYELALNGDSANFAGFATVAKEFSGTAAGNLATAYAGLCCAHLEKFEDAVKYLDQFTGSDQLVGPAVKAALGNCYVNLGQEEKGAELLVKAAKDADSQALSPVYYIQAGQVYEKLGKSADALKLYQTVKEKYFQSYLSIEIDKYIERVSK
ncbi:MAG: hypothetical protein Q4E55_05590 [Bacteroidales bacterium]|nr:hypothetical protein [Bacteroidales bacterium]